MYNYIEQSERMFFNAVDYSFLYHAFSMLPHLKEFLKGMKYGNKWK
jgi:hypothetical protein